MSPMTHRAASLSPRLRLAERKSNAGWRTIRVPRPDTCLWTDQQLRSESRTEIAGSSWRTEKQSRRPLFLVPVSCRCLRPARFSFHPYRGEFRNESPEYFPQTTQGPRASPKASAARKSVGLRVRRELEAPASEKPHDTGECCWVPHLRR